MPTNDDDEPLDAAGHLARDLRMFAARVIASPLRRYEIDAGGDDVSGEYFLVEVLNIPTLGPRVPLAPSADPWDETLDLVLAGDAERDPLLAAIDALARGENQRLELPTRQIARVRIEGDIQRYHRDGTHCEERTRSVSVTVEPGALVMLAPPAHRS